MSAYVSGAFAATGQSSAFQPVLPPPSQPGITYECGTVDVYIWGTGATFTVTLERSIDGGTTWLQNRINVNGNTTVFDQFTSNGYQQVADIPAGTLLRLNCSALASGTINYQVGRAQ